MSTSKVFPNSLMHFRLSWVRKFHDSNLGGVVMKMNGVEKVWGSCQ